MQMTDILLVRSNDAFDADMNIDGNKPESLVNLTGNRHGVLATAWACFAVGVAWLWSLVTGPVRALVCCLVNSFLEHAFCSDTTMLPFSLWVCVCMCVRLQLTSCIAVHRLFKGIQE